MQVLLLLLLPLHTCSLLSSAWSSLWRKGASAIVTTFALVTSQHTGAGWDVRLDQRKLLQAMQLSAAVVGTTNVAVYNDEDILLLMEDAFHDSPGLLPGELLPTLSGRPHAVAQATIDATSDQCVRQPNT